MNAEKHRHPPRISSFGRECLESWKAVGIAIQPPVRLGLVIPLGYVVVREQSGAADSGVIFTLRPRLKVFVALRTAPLKALPTLSSNSASQRLNEPTFEWPRLLLACRSRRRCRPGLRSRVVKANDNGLAASLEAATQALDHLVLRQPLDRRPPLECCPRLTAGHRRRIQYWDAGVVK